MDERPHDPFLGRDVGGYRLESRIGSGATGIVYRATHPNHDKPVAVKVLHEDLGRISSLKRRFEREARALSKLSHPSIVHITDFGAADGATFLAMELLQGETLEERMQRGPLAPSDVLSIAKAFLGGLGFAHTLQIVHRDLKPANIFLPVASDSHVKVLDFGLAKFLSIEEISSEATLTRKGRVVGTPAYMSPEQITGVALDVRADVYAAGIVLFELIADARPFDYEKRSDLLRAHLFEEVPPLERVRPGLSVHPKLESIVRTSLAKDPGRRFANATEMSRALEALPPDPIRLGLPQRVRSRTRRRGDSASVLLSQGEMLAIASGSSNGEQPPKARRAAPRPAVQPDAPLGALPFDALERTSRISAPPRAPVGPIVRRIVTWLLLVALGLAVGSISYIVGKTL